MATRVTIAEAFAGDSLGGNSKRIFARKPGRGGRRGPKLVASLDEPELLEDFLFHDPDGRRISVLLRYSEYQDSFLRGEELTSVITEVQQALVPARADSDTTSMLEQLLALTRQARDQGLVLGLLAD